MASRFEIRKKRTKVLKQAYQVVTIGENNKTLQTSEKLSSVDDAYTNIYAVCDLAGSPKPLIIETFK